MKAFPTKTALALIFQELYFMKPNPNLTSVKIWISSIGLNNSQTIVNYKINKSKQGIQNLEICGCVA